MSKIRKSFKNWYSVAKPKKTVWFFQWFTSVIPSSCTVISALPAAKVITCMTVTDYTGAVIYLCVIFGLTLLSDISWHLQYMLDIKQLRAIYPRIQEHLFNKIFRAEDASFKYNSKEKIINTITNNITTLSDFCDYSAFKSAYLVEAIITLVIIFSINWIVGLLIFSIAILVFFIMNALNHAIAKLSNNIYDERDKLTESFADMIDSREMSNDMNLKDKLHKKYFDRIDNILKKYKKRNVLKSFRDNWVLVLYTLIILIATLYIVKLVADNVVTLTIYLVLTPYLTSAITKFVNFFGLIDNLETANISALRVKTLLDMSEKDIVNFGKNSTSKISGALTFTNVEYSSKDKIDKSANSIKTFNTQIQKGEIVLFEGERNCGKRAIFYMLRRAIRPDSGTITFDTVNIYDFDSDTYKHNISYITSKPYFYIDSIMENLRIVDNNKRHIYEACKKAGIHEDIMALADGYNTNLSLNPSALNDGQKFLLGLARALLTKCEILMIYEFPVGLSNKELKQIKSIITSLKSRHTILVFASNNPIDDIITKHFLIENGNITEIASDQEKSMSNISVDTPFSKVAGQK